MPGIFRRLRGGEPKAGGLAADDVRVATERRQTADNEARRHASEEETRRQAAENEIRRDASDADALRQRAANETRRRSEGD